MKKHKKANKNKQFRLSPSGRLFVAVNLVLASPLAMAGGINAIGTTTVNNKSGIDIINIATPSNSGLSHNQYNDFNVSESGAVFNNSLTNGTSQLAGELSKNTNFKDKAASVILNEVVSKNPSLILGSQEVFGMAADYVLANPNGIAYNGGKMINAPRASFVVGSPEVNNGSLESFNTDSDNSLTVNGGDFSDVETLDLLAPQVEINSNVSTKSAINVASGHNNITYDDVPNITTIENNKDVVLDGRVFGSMSSGTIRVHSTDGGQVIKGADITARDELLIDTTGDLSVTTSNLSGGDMDLSAQNIKLDGAVEKTSDNTQNRQKSRRRVVTETKTDSFKEAFSGSSITANNLHLESSEDILVSSAEITANGDLDIDANNITFDTVTTTESESTYEKKSKLSWFNKTETSQSKETVHTNKISVKGNVDVDVSGQFNAEALTLDVDGNSSKISAKEGINLTSTAGTNTYHYNNEVKNETFKLKTGHLRKDNTSQDFYGSEINVADGDLLLTTDGDITLQGTTVDANNVLTDANAVLLDAAVTKMTDVNDKKFRFLGGADEHNTSTDKEYAHASNVLVDKEVLINTKNGVKLQGSNIVTDGQGYLLAGDGDLVIDGKVLSESEYERNREGTIFNITKSEVENSQTVEGVSASEIKSHTNLELVSAKDINVSGSVIEVAESLDIDAGNSFNLGTTETHSTTENHTAGTKGDAGYKYDIAGLTGGVEVSITASDEKTKTETTGNTGSKVSVGDMNVTAKQDAVIKGSEVTATGDVNVNAADISVVAATDNKKTNKVSNTTKVGVGADVAFNGGTPSITGTAGVNVAHKETNTTGTTAQGTVVKGDNINLTTNDGVILNEGSALDATGDVNQKAKEIKQVAAANTTDTTEVTINGGVNVTAGTNTAKFIHGSVGVDVSGGKKVTTTSDAVVANVSADNVSNVAEKVTDIGTQYDVDDSVNITADNYINEVAKNTTSEVNHSGGGSIGVSASTSDMTTVNVDAEIKGNYAHTNAKTSTAIKGNIEAGSLNITATDKVKLASDVNVKDDANITATNGVTLTQSHNTTEKTEAGANANLSIGAVIVPEAMAALPSFKVGADAKYNKTTTDNGVGSSIKAENVTINGGKLVAVDGSDIAGNVNIKADTVTSNGLTNTTTQKGGSGNANVAVGANLSGSTSFGLGFDGGKSEETTHTANNISGGNVNLVAKDELTLTGTNVKGDDVTLSNTNGGVTLDSLTGSKKVTKVGAGVSIDGSIDEGVFNAGSGSANVDIDVARNKTNTGSSVTANTATINSNGDLNLTDSTVKADKLSGKVNGDVNIIANQDVTNEFGLNLAASGGGKPAKIVKVEKEEAPADEKKPSTWDNIVTVINQAQKLKGEFDNITTDGKITSDNTSEVIDTAASHALELAGKFDNSGTNAIEVIQSDVSNGTIMGVSAAASANLHIDNTLTTQSSGLNVGTANLEIDGIINNHAGSISYIEGLDTATINNSSNADHSTKIDFGFNVSTDLSEMAEQAVKHIQTGESSLGYAKGEIVRKHTVGGTVNN